MSASAPSLYATNRCEFFGNGLTRCKRFNDFGVCREDTFRSTQHDPRSRLTCQRHLHRTTLSCFLLQGQPIRFFIVLFIRHSNSYQAILKRIFLQVFHFPIFHILTAMQFPLFHGITSAKALLPVITHVMPCRWANSAMEGLSPVMGISACCIA